MRLQYYNGFYDNAPGMQCDMDGFILQYGNEENLQNLTLNFPPGGPADKLDLPNGTFSIVPPAQGIKCGNHTVNFSPTNFNGLPKEAVVRYTFDSFNISGKTKRIFFVLICIIDI